MTAILLGEGLEDSGSDVEPFVASGWRYRVRPGKDYVNGSGVNILAEWPNGGGWKPFASAVVTLQLDPLPADNPYYLEIAGPPDPTSRDRKPVFRSEYRQVLAGTANGTSWYALTRVSGPGPDATVYGLAGYADLVAQIAALELRLDNVVPPDGGASDVSAVAGISVFSRSYLDDADAAAVRATIGAGTSSLAIGTSGSTAKVGNYQPAAANITDATTVGKAVLTAADAAAARTAIGAGTSSIALGTTTGTAGDGGVVAGLVTTVAAKADLNGLGLVDASDIDPAIARTADVAALISTAVAPDPRGQVIPWFCPNNTPIARALTKARDNPQDSVEWRMQTEPPIDGTYARAGVDTYTPWDG